MSRAKIGLFCSISTLVTVLLVSSLYDVVISGLDYFKEPEPFGCERKDNLTENIENAVKVFSIVSFVWAIVFITVFIVISTVFVVTLTCYRIRGDGHYKIFEKKILLIILNVATIVGFPAPLFNVSLFLFKCGTAYGILSGGIFLYFCTGIVTIVVESFRTGYIHDKAWKIFKKVAGTLLHVIELSASFAVFAGLFDSFTRAQRNINIAYIVFASILAISTWLRNVLDNIETYYCIIKKEEGSRLSKHTYITSFILCICHIIVGVALMVVLSYDIHNNVSGATEVIALVLMIISILGNIVYCVITFVSLCRARSTGSSYAI